MNGGSTSVPLVLLVAVHFLLDSPANGGVVDRSIRMVREVYPPDTEPENDGVQPQVCIVGDVVYGADGAVPADQPCLKCRCQPPGVQCETVQCAKKPGCKAIHRPNKCCPDYQCECEHGGRIYANGEKLDANPGSECKVCYCRGGEVQCAEVSCYIRNDCEGKRVPGTCCPKYDHCPPIDAVLDRASPSSSTVTEPSPTEEIPEDSNRVPDASGVATTTEDGVVGSHPRITIQEIIPERKEIPITAPPRASVPESQGTLLIEEALPTSDNSSSNDLDVVDSEPESSEVSEVFRHPPPVLRIGDKLLFFKDGNLVPEKDATTTSSDGAGVITVIGAEGLQRGGLEESLEFQPTEADNKDETIKESLGSDDDEIKEGVGNDKDEIKDSVGTDKQIEDKIEEVVGSNKETDDGIEESHGNDKQVPETNDLELKSAESSHILSAAKVAENTEEVPTTSTSGTEEPSTTEAATTEKIEESSTTKTTEPITEQNPAYPPLPDAMPGTDHAAESKILPEVFDLLSNATKKNLTAGGADERLKVGGVDNETETLADFRAGSLPEELLREKSPIDDELDSGEQTTPKTNVSVLTEPEDERENASVETELGNVELTDAPIENNPRKQDVELIDLTDAPKPTRVARAETSTYELLPTPEEAKLTKPIKRRDVPPDDVDVFGALEKELTAAQTPPPSPKEERQEAERIFQELLDETDGKTTTERSAEQQKIDSLSNALADVALRGKTPDAATGVLRLIGGLFGGPRGQ